MAKSRNIFKIGLGYTIGNYLLKGIVFITTPIFARLMTTSDYGKYSVFASYESIFFVLIGFAIHSSYKNAYYKFRDADNPEDESGYQKYLSVTMCFLFASFIFWLIVALILNKPIAAYLSVDQIVLYMIVVGSMITAIMSCYTADKGIHFEYKSIIIISLISTVASIGLSLLLMKTIFSNRMYLGRIIGGIIPGVVVYFSIAINYIIKASPRGMTRGLRWGIKYSLPIVPHGISQVILTQFDRIMILRIIGDSQAGVYSIAYLVYSMLAVTSSSIDGIWAPWFYEKRKAEDYDTIKKGSNLYFLMMLMASVGVILLCPEIIAILGGEKYKDAVYCSIPIVVGGFFACIYNVPCLVEYYHEKTKLIAISTAFAALLNIVLNSVFIPKYGYVAAAYTTLATYTLYFIAHYVMALFIEKRCLFSTRIIVACILLLAADMALSLAFINMLLVRAVVMVISVGLMMLYEEKRNGYFRQWIYHRK